MKWTSNAEWPREAYANGASTDTHDTLEQALAVCSRLEREGFGGDRVHFPLRTWVEEADQEATADLDLSQFERFEPSAFWVELRKAVHGQWIRYSDAAKLDAEVKRLREDVALQRTVGISLAGILAEIAIASGVGEDSEPPDILEVIRRLRAKIAELERDRAEHVSPSEAQDLQSVLNTIAPTGRAFLTSARRLRELFEKQSDRITELEREVERLAAWKESMLAVESEWDLQEIAQMLSIPLGTSIRAQLKPAIERLLGSR